MKDDNYLKPYSKKDSERIMLSDNDRGVGICSSYSDGKCLENPGNYCDGCATEYGNEHY